MAAPPKPTQYLEQQLQQSLLLERPRQSDHLALPDSILLAALNGSRPLRPAERKLLQSSPITLRRFKHLALQNKAGAWRGSEGLVLAAASEQAERQLQLQTSDQYWQLHIVQAAPFTAAAHWQLILRLHPAAPFARQLLAQAATVRVLDGLGGILLEGILDSDGELEASWPFGLPPLAYFAQHGGSFRVQTVAE